MPVLLPGPVLVCSKVYTDAPTRFPACCFLRDTGMPQYGLNGVRTNSGPRAAASLTTWWTMARRVCAAAQALS